MQFCNSRALRAVAMAAGLGVFGAAGATIDPSGQWVGSSGLEGSRSSGKTTLVLGAADSDGSTLRIEDRSNCLLKQGRYRADGDGWSLTFQEAKGGEACTRLAQGTFSLQQGSGPRALLFEVRYPGPDGQQNLRRGALSRYP